MDTLGVVLAKVVLRGSKGSREYVALVDTGAAMAVIDKKLAEAIGVTYMGKKRSLISATGQKLEGEIAIIKELSVEDETLDYEKLLSVSLSEEVKEVLRKLGVDDSIILGLTTVELEGFMPDASTGRLRKIEAFLF
ncbi:MAG: aspartyl protease family protein [Nitrososphaerales archaeon]